MATTKDMARRRIKALAALTDAFSGEGAWVTETVRTGNATQGSLYLRLQKGDATSIELRLYSLAPRAASEGVAADDEPYLALVYRAGEGTIEAVAKPVVLPGSLLDSLAETDHVEIPLDLSGSEGFRLAARRVGGSGDVLLEAHLLAAVR